MSDKAWAGWGSLDGCHLMGGGPAVRPRVHLSLIRGMVSSTAGRRLPSIRGPSIVPKCFSMNSSKFTLPKKQIPCESLLSLFARSKFWAKDLTSSLAKPPMGKTHLSSWSLRKLARKYVWSFFSSMDMDNTLGEGSPAVAGWRSNILA